MNRARHAIQTGLIALAVLALVQYFVSGGWSGFFASLRSAAAASIAWAGSSVSIPVWLLAILAASALTAIGVATSVACQAPRKGEICIESPMTAKIFGIRWRWTNREGNILDIAAFCPKCDLPVGPRMEARHGFIHLISYQCQCGKWRSQSFQCTQVDFINRVYRAIKQGAVKGHVEAAPGR